METDKAGHIFVVKVASDCVFDHGLKLRYVIGSSENRMTQCPGLVSTARGFLYQKNDLIAFTLHKIILWSIQGKVNRL